MDILMICIFACWVMLVICFAAYALLTNNIINEQKKIIAKLRKYEKIVSEQRIERALKGSRFREDSKA